MKILVCALCIFSAQSFACGTWILEDMQSQRKIRFKKFGVEWIDAKRPDPEFMNSGKDSAFLIQGHRLDYANMQLRYLKLNSYSPKAKRIFEAEILGTLSEAMIQTKKSGTYQISTSQSQDDEKSIQLVVTHGGKTVAQGNLKVDCQTQGEAREQEIKHQRKRVASYFAWKELGLDPFAKPVENWWR